MSNSEYIFSLVTRGGAPTNMHKKISKSLKKKNKKLDAFSYATAPNTFDIISEVPTNEVMEQARMDFDKDVKEFAEVVNERKTSINRGYRNAVVESFLFPILRGLMLITGYFKLQDGFYADDNCTSCGV